MTSLRFLIMMAAIGCGGTDKVPGDGSPPPDERVVVDGATASWNVLHLEQSEGVKTMAINATSAGSLMVVGIETGAAPVVGVSDDASNGYVAIPEAHATDANQNRGLELWYAPNVNGGAKLLTIDAPVVNAILVWEVAGIDPVAPFDVGAKLDDQAAATTVLGPSLTTTTDREFVVTAVVVENTVVELINTGVFASDPTIANTGRGHVSSKLAPPGSFQASWTQLGTGTFCSSAAAFFAAP